MVAALAAVLFPAYSSPPARAEVRVSVQPYFEADAAPGQTVTGTISVRNPGSEPILLNIEIQDYAQAETGPRFDAPGEGPFGAGEWISVSPRALALNPREQKHVRVSIRVPDRAVTHTYSSVVFFVTQAAANPSVGATALIRGKLGSLVLIRVRGKAPAREAGIIEGISGPNLVFSLPAALAVRYRNTGNIHSRASGEVVLEPLLFGRKMRVPMAGKRVLPGAGVSLEGALTDGPAFGVYRVGANIRDLFEKKPLAALPPVKLLVIVPWRFPAGLGLAVLGLVLFRRTNRKGRVEHARAWS